MVSTANLPEKVLVSQGVHTPLPQGRSCYFVFFGGILAGSCVYTCFKIFATSVYFGLTLNRLGISIACVPEVGCVYSAAANGILG